MKSAEKCPLFTVISATADGDVIAIEKILKHYDAKKELRRVVNFE